MFKLILILNLASGFSCADSLRNFPAGTIYGVVDKYKYPDLELEPISSSWLSSLTKLNSNKNLELSPATTVRDRSNFLKIQGYLTNLIGKSVACQLNYQSQIASIWELSESEVDFAKENNLNRW